MTDSLQPAVRRAIQGLPTYKAGKQVPAVEGLSPFKLSSNEIAFEPLPSVIDAIAQHAHNIHRYPDPLATKLMEALASKLGVSTQCLATGTGSVGICQQIVQALADAGDEVIFAWRSFEAYPIITAIAGAQAITIELDQHGAHDLPAMARAVTDRTKVMFLCTPNNPTGNIITQQAFDEFITEIPKHVLVVIDEAYVEFNRSADALDGLQAMKMHSNVCVLRTFSKAYGLAGLRVGYFVGPEHIAEAVRKTAVPFGVSSLAQAAAIASLEHERELFDRVDSVIKARTDFVAALEQLGIHAGPSEANFIWWPLGDRTDKFAQLCAEHAIAVRAFSGEGVRITIGEAEAMDRVLGVVQKFLQD